MNKEKKSIELEENSNKSLGISLIVTSVVALIFLVFTSVEAINLILDDNRYNDHKFYGWLLLTIASNVSFIVGTVLVVIGSIQNTIIKSHNLQLTVSKSNP
ncbi:hypothetical protein [Vibrio cyclitrophicus]|uniref:hypothetical protein n=1 Tax=Vibrio cyclitrophicus TaxID=47951 RepID=UPI000C84522A|nr:hypothetical protein [Vibrio cyclitrophicus]PMJ79294.1 hypothetical protein BCU15_11085 [Vibrio cyclitrophicus]